MEDLLIEFDEFGFSPTITMPNPEEYAIEWKKRLLKAIDELECEARARAQRLTLKSIMNLSTNHSQRIEEVKQGTIKDLFEWLETNAYLGDIQKQDFIKYIKEKYNVEVK